MKYAVARFLWSIRPLYRIVTKARSRVLVFDHDFDLLFDGFPRSGNTYGADMLLVTQRDRIKVVTHHHRPSLFFHAARVGKPACLTLRQPIDAIPSWVIYTDFSLQKVIDYYIFFYEVLLPDRSNFLVLPFPVVTTDFPLVLHLINRRFGMNLDVDVNFEKCSREAFSRIDEFFKDKMGAVDKLKVARPDEVRKKRSAQLRQDLLSPRYAAGLKHCQDLYQIYEAEFSRDVARLQPAVRS